MTLSVDSSCTQSACLTTSARKKRNSASVESDSKDARKKIRSASLSETSPQRPLLCNTELRLTRDSAERKTVAALCFQGSSPEIVANAADITADLNETRCHDDVLGSAHLCNGRRGMSSAEMTSVRSMILHSQQLAHAILAEYEREREKTIVQNSEMAAEVLQMKQCGNASAKEIKSLRSTNEELGRKEAAATAKLQELQASRLKREGVLVAAALAVSKALMLGERDMKKSIASVKAARLRFENQKLLKERADAEGSERFKLETLRVTNEELSQALSEAQAEREKLMKELEETKTASNLLSQDFLSQLAAGSSEVENLLLELEMLRTERNKVELEKRKAQEGELELRKLLLQKDTHAAEVQAQFQISLEKCTCLEGQQLELLLEKEKFSQKIKDSEELANAEVERLTAKNKSLVQEHERVKAALNRTLAQCSEFRGVVYQLRNLQTERGTEMDNLRTELAKRGAELDVAKDKLAHVTLKNREADLRAAAEIRKLTKEMAETQAREETALLKLRKYSMTSVPRPHSKMHLAFLINCGMLRSDALNYDLQPSDLPQSLTCPR